MSKRIGFVGLGQMGQPMALNLLHTGYRLRVFDLREERMAPLVAEGAEPGASPGAVTEPGGIVLSMVPDDRTLLVVALGEGGILSRLAASLIVRGIRLVHLPTTMLAATDSILSCKQGVNGEPSLDLLIKNLVGTFKAPEFALVYLSFWQSLAPDEIRSGLCELVKNVLAIHPQRYEEVAALLNPEASYSLDQFAQVFTWCFEAKQAVMRQDAHEQGAALVLEAGHTVGHALESLLGMKHGLAIALGLLVEAHISHARGWLSDREVRQHYSLLGRNGVPTTLPQELDMSALMRIIGDDNKIGYLPRREDHHVMVLLRGLGQPVEERPGLPLTYVSEAELRTALATLRA